MTSDEGGWGLGRFDAWKWRHTAHTVFHRIIKFKDTTVLVKTISSLISPEIPLKACTVHTVFHRMTKFKETTVLVRTISRLISPEILQQQSKLAPCIQYFTVMPNSKRPRFGLKQSLVSFRQKYPRKLARANSISPYYQIQRDNGLGQNNLSSYFARDAPASLHRAYSISLYYQFQRGHAFGENILWYPIARHTTTSLVYQISPLFCSFFFCL